MNSSNPIEYSPSHFNCPNVVPLACNAGVEIAIVLSRIPLTKSNA